MGAEKVVGNKWRWFTDYAFLWAEWTINVEQGRAVEVGTGVSIGGNPIGGKFRVSGHKTFKTYGAGAIHVRSADGKGACIVRVDQGKAGLITIYRDPSLINAALDDLKAAIESR